MLTRHKVPDFGLQIVIYKDDATTVREKGLALAAFGLGTYSFDDVEIVAGDEVENPFENKILKLPPRFKKAPFKTY